MLPNRLPDTKPKYITHYIEDKEINKETNPVRIEKKGFTLVPPDALKTDLKNLQDLNALLQAQLKNSLKSQDEQLAIIAAKNVALQVKDNEDYIQKCLAIIRLIAKPVVRRKELEALGAVINNFHMTAKICGITFKRRTYTDEYRIIQGTGA